MACPTRFFQPTRLVASTLASLLVAALVAEVCAQTSQTAPAAPTTLDPVTVTGRATPPPGVGGWGETPLAKTPLQATVIGAEELKDRGATRLSDLTATDPGVSDAYNSEGYWDFLSVRGYVLDNRFNFRRDGLPINAETSIPLDNKARIEILKGISGMQAGTSAPGGLVNYVVKRPTGTPLRQAFVEWRQPGSITGAIDLSQRFGTGDVFGLRLNAAAARLDPMVRSSEGRRTLLALAGDWRIGGGTLIEAEFETSHRSQPSRPGFSMLGDTVPAPADPRLSLNNQPWSQPVVFDADTASLRLTQQLGAGWSFVAHAASQRLRTDDRLAFPFGCSDPEPAPNGTYYADRYCPNGTYDLYDFRSDDERRRLDVVDVSVRGALQTGRIGHLLTAGIQHGRVRNRFGGQAYNYAGSGNVDGTLFTDPAPALAFDANTNRDERSTELYLRDAVRFDDRLTGWLGLRHSRVERDSARTDGSRATGYRQTFTTPWLALSYAFAPDQLVYASWGRGVESEVVPNLPFFTNAGAALPALEGRQLEVGLKGAVDRIEWSLAWFDIVRPQFGELAGCAETSSCTRRLDGVAHHRGAEAGAALQRGAWTLRGGAQWLHARRERAQLDAAANGLEPTNVPAFTVKLQAGYDVESVAGLSLQANALHESRRMVLPDNSASIPGFSRIDAALRYDRRLGGARWTWRAGIDNLFDKRAWRESPYQFSHAYLFPLAPRTLRLSVQTDL